MCSCASGALVIVLLPCRLSAPLIIGSLPVNIYGGTCGLLQCLLPTEQPFRLTWRRYSMRLWRSHRAKAI